MCAARFSSHQPSGEYSSVPLDLRKARAHALDAALEEGMLRQLGAGELPGQRGSLSSEGVSRGQGSSEVLLTLVIQPTLRVRS